MKPGLDCSFPYSDSHTSLLARLPRWLARGVVIASKIPTPRWHVWDAAPWDHPFLTAENLQAMRAFSDRLFLRLEEDLSNLPKHVRQRPLRFAFTGNIANDLYQRIRALSPHGLTPDLVQNPQDTFLMSDPRWEEFDGTAPDGLDRLDEADVWHRSAQDVVCRVLRPPQAPPRARRLKKLRATYRPTDLLLWPEFFSLLPLFECLREYDAVLGTQVPFVPYLANMPYLLTQSGSDIRINANRGDAYGALHRAAYRNCFAFLISNPWSIAHARRLGLKKAVILPALINEDIYKPGPPVFRNEWQQKIGGNFFVLSTSRLNDELKGSSKALRGFSLFAQKVPEARLVVIEWGQQKDLARKLLAELGLEHRVIFLPLSGKRRLLSYLRSADCLLDQFVLKQLGSTAREALAVGLPVIIDVHTTQYDAYFDGELPILNAATPEQICQALLRLHNDPAFHEATRQASRNWFLQNMSGARWAKRYQQILTACALNISLDFSDSPLQQPLSDTEKEFLKSGLENAPAHP